MPFKGKQDKDQANDDQTAAVEEIITAEVETLRPSQRAVLELLSSLENIATEDTDENGFMGDDIASILLAENEQEMWEGDELPRLNAKVLSGCQLDVYGFEVKFSNSPEIESALIGPVSRKKMYLLVKSARLNNAGNSNLYKLPEVGEEFVWNTSARFIVAKLFWLRSRGRFDDGRTVHAQIVGTDLDGAKRVEKLKPMDMPVMAGQAEEPPF